MYGESRTKKVVYNVKSEYTRKTFGKKKKRRERKREITVDFKISHENLAEKKKGGRKLV